MNSRRKKVEDFIIDKISKLTHKDEKNINLYKDFFSKMSDAEFDKFMQDLKDKKINLSIIVPHGSGEKVTVNNNLKLGEELGVKFFQRLVYSPRGDIPGFVTNKKMLIVKLPIKRVSQTLTKKISVQEDNIHRDVLTGQVSGVSKANRITFPEIQVLSGYGLKDTIIELIKTRGGDQGESNVLDAMLLKHGRASRSVISQYQTGVRSTQTLKSFLNAMHIRSTL